MRTTANYAMLEAGCCCNYTEDPTEPIQNEWICQAPSCPLHIPVPTRVPNSIRRRLKKMPLNGRPLYTINIG